MSNTDRTFVPVVFVHGGAGNIPNSRDLGKHNGTKIAARLGYDKLLETGSVIDAVEEAVRSMELDENFNCGIGSVLTLNGQVQVEAGIMDGRNLNAGCVSLLEDIIQPVSVARMVMERSRHAFIGGEGAMQFAREQNVPILSPPGQLITQYAKEALETFKGKLERGESDYVTELGNRDTTATIKKDFGEVGTVGAVAIDQFGNLAAATSSGGVTGKVFGRMGGSPLLGSGTYADNLLGAVSTTGHGESIMKYNVAIKILQRIEHLNETAAVATERVLTDMETRLNHKAGAITIDAKGNLGCYFTSRKMAWAYRKENTVHYGINKGEDLTEAA